MKNLTTEEMLQLVKELVQKHHITAYEIGENTDLNTSGVHRILNGEVQNPRIKTLRTILEYIEDKLVGHKSGQGHPSPSEAQAMEASQYSIQKVIAQEVLNLLKPELEEFKGYHQAIMRALASQAIDIEEFKAFIEKLNLPERSGGSKGRN
jgi:transcriptional regulator with XRE-family HTH domain